MGDALRVIFFCLLFQLSATSIKAQVFFAGFEAGVTYNHLNTDLFNQISFANKNGVGYALDVLLKLTLNKHLSLNLHPGILQKNYTFKRTGDFEGIFSHHTNTYLQMPVTTEILIWTATKKIRLFSAVGLFATYWLAGNVKGKVPAIFSATDRTSGNGEVIENFQLSYYDGNYAFDCRKDNRIELGWLCGISMQYDCNSKNKLVISLKYLQSSTDQQKNYSINQMSRHNQTLNFTIGWLASFK